MASGKSRGRTSKKIMRPVMVGLQLLMVNMHVLQDETDKKSTTEGRENISGKSCEWFQEDQFLEIMKGLKPVLMSRINCPQPTSSKQNYQSKELKSMKGLTVRYNFKKRPNIPGQHFVMTKSESIICLCGKKVTKKIVNYKSCPIFHETLEIEAKKSITVESESDQSDSVQHQKPVKEIKENRLKEAATSSYFSEQTVSLQTSSVKRKKTTLRKMAKKSRIALIELPSYEKTSKSQAVPQEQRKEDVESTSSDRNRGFSRPVARATKTTVTTAVIDLERVPEGLKNVSKVEDLREDHLEFLINQMEDYLRTIFRGEVYCRRHEDYKKGGKCRDDLNFQVGMAHFSEDQHECILSSLVAMFCYRDNKYLDYVTKVMLPEALIKLYQDIHKTSFEEAEECLFNDTIRDN